MISDMPFSTDQLHARGMDSVSAGGEFLVARVEIEFINKGIDNVTFDPVTALRTFANETRIRDELISAYSKHDAVFANGVMPSGEEFVPFWSNPDAAELWLDDYPGCQKKAVPVARYIDWMARELNSHQMLGAIGFAGQMMTAHPLLLRDLLKTRE